MTQELMRMVTDRHALALPDAFIRGDVERLDASTTALESFARSVPLEPVRLVIDEAIRRFDPENPTSRSESDGWLAPRVHASLRLTPREAADPAVWRHLSLFIAPDYVRWRFRDSPVDRFLGSINKHALARLWWGAEFTRNGADYSLVRPAFLVQDIPNSWQFRLFHNRPVAIAVVEIVDRAARAGLPDLGRRANRLLQAANVAARTTVLDVVAPYDGPDPVALGDWIGEEPDASTMLDELPRGPDEEAVPRASVEGATSFLRRVSAPFPQLAELFEPNAQARAA